MTFPNPLSAHPDVFQHVFDSHPDGLCLVDPDGLLIMVNPSFLRMVGYTRDEILQKPLAPLLDRRAKFRSDPGDDEISRSEIVIRHKEGHVVHVRSTSIPIVCDGQATGRFFTFEDITEQRKRAQKLTDIQEMFAFISEKSQNIISSYSADGVFTYVSPTVRALLGYDPEEVIGRPATDFNHPEDNRMLREFRRSEFLDKDTVRFTGRVRHKDGGYRWYETTVEYIRDPSSGEIIQSIGVGRDITDRKKAEETIAHLAFHDALTDLPNRRFFKNRAHQLLQRPDGFHGLMLLDLDGYKYVNDTFGHDIGDLLLIEVAKRLQQTVGDGNLVSRWGGDEFTILLAGMRDKADVASFIQRVRDAVSEPYLIAGHKHFISASLGVSYYPEDGDDVESLIRKADAEMYRHKNEAKNESFEP